MNTETSKSVVYLALGDSTGVGVGATSGGGYVARLFERIEQIRPGSRLINLCVSGATTYDVLRDQIRGFAGDTPTLVTLGIGVNDVQRLMLEEYERNLEEIVGQVRAVTEAPVILTNIPDIASAPGVPEIVREELRRRIETFNAAIERVVERQQLVVVDVYTKSCELLPGQPRYFCDDLFHPSDEGYEFWADEMWPTIEKHCENDR